MDFPFLQKTDSTNWTVPTAGRGVADSTAATAGQAAASPGIWGSSTLWGRATSPGGIMAMAGLLNIGGAIAGYQPAKDQAAAMRLQAENYRIQAMEQGNAIRSQLATAINNAMAAGAARGVETGGSVTSTAEFAARHAGEDIQTLAKRGELAAKNAEAQAEYARRMGKSQMWQGIANAVGGTASGTGGLYLLK